MQAEKMEGSKIFCSIGNEKLLADENAVGAFEGICIDDDRHFYAIGRRDFGQRFAGLDDVFIAGLGG